MNTGNYDSIHSRYNPQREAERYIASLGLNENIRFFILIEPGLGYIIGPLRKRSPHSKIIALHAGHFAAAKDPEMQGENSPDSQWHPGLGIPVQDFLEQEIPDTQADKIKILEWRPALAVYGGAYLSLVEESAAFIKRSDANYRTLKAFGQNWFGNFLKNLRIIRYVIRPHLLSMPLVITGAGPSLEGQIPLLQEASSRGEIFILAVSSSVAALAAASVVPNMIISTDGGGWARFHLYECIRAGAAPKVMEVQGTGKSRKPLWELAAAMTAALPSQCAALSILPIGDGSVWQTLVLKALGIPFITLPQRGTVAAAALDLAFSLTDAEVYITGIDLASKDISMHARPYSLDHEAEKKGMRLDPIYSQMFKRSAMVNTGGSFGIYASWFERQLSSYPKRLFSLGKNNPLFDTLGPSLAMGSHKGNSAANFSCLELEAENNSPGKALLVLEAGLKDPLLTEKLSIELSTLLFPGKGKIPANELMDALKSTGQKWGGSSFGNG